MGLRHGLKGQGVAHRQIGDGGAVSIAFAVDFDHSVGQVHLHGSSRLDIEVDYVDLDVSGNVFHSGGKVAVAVDLGGSAVDSHGLDVLTIDHHDCGLAVLHSAVLHVIDVNHSLAGGGHIGTILILVGRGRGNAEVV